MNPKLNPETQALSAAPAVTSEQRRLIGVIADKIEDGTLFQSGIYPKKDLARFVRNMLDATPTTPAASPTPTAEQQAASSAVLKAIREANMQLVRTGDNAFMLVPYKVATAQAADSVPAVSDLPPLPDPDLRDVGTKPQEIKEFLNGYATEYARTAIAARAPADSVLEDAERYRFIRDVPYSDDVRSVLVHQQNAAMDRVIDAAMNKGGAA